MKVLVTGGAGYIGSHVVLELLQQGHDVHVVDDLSNSTAESLRRVGEIVGRAAGLTVADVRDERTLDVVFHEFAPTSVIHLAGLKSVGESVAQPGRYYDVNINSTIVLLATMRRHGVTDIVFSSSATVYGEPSELPLRETSRVGVGIMNPYGRTKYFLEEIIRDHAVADAAFRVAILRYFNPVGAHPSGRIGEDPSQIPNNLAPYITQVAVGRLPYLRVFGDTYDTIDGTGVRDYIHVMDLADGHVAALSHLNEGVQTVNLGTGKGTSVLELLHAFSIASDREIPCRVEGARAGDVAAAYADAGLASESWGWRTRRTLQDACADAWRWQSSNPNGYRD